MRDLRNKVVVVTGSASGIGKALARGLCAKGAHLALVDIDESRLAEIAAELDAKGQRVSTHVADVGDRRRMQALPGEVVAEHAHIVNLSSMFGIFAMPGQAIYSTSKAGCAPSPRRSGPSWTGLPCG